MKRIGECDSTQKSFRRIGNIREACHCNCVSRNGRKEEKSLLIRHYISAAGLLAAAVRIEYGDSCSDSQNHSGHNGQAKYERLSAHYLTAIASISTFTPRGRAAA